MKESTAHKLTRSFLAIAFIVLLPQLVAAEKTPGTLKEAFSLIMNNYVESPNPSYLTSNAINGMIELLESKKIDFARPDIDLSSIKGDKDAALKQILRTYSELLKSANDQSQELESAAIRGMVSSLDPHSSYMTVEAYKEMFADMKAQFSGVGLQLGLKSGKVVVVAPSEDSPAFRAGIKPGDAILKINGITTNGLELQGAVKRMRGEKGTTVTLTIDREGFKEPREFIMQREVVNVKSVKAKMLDDHVGYIKIIQLAHPTGPELERALRDLESQGMKKLILDLRNNPGGLLDSSVEVAGKFLSRGLLVVSLQGRQKSDHKDYLSVPADFVRDCPLIVLVNKGTASGAEIVTGALQDSKRAVILGSLTFGKGAIQTAFSLNDGSGMRLTTARLYTPSNKLVDGGITPDVYVPEKENDDLPLTVALTTMQTEKEFYIPLTKLVSRAQTIASAKNSAATEMVQKAPTAKPAMQTPSLVVTSDVDNLPTTKVKKQPNNYAIVIGIEQYRQNLPKADFAVHDAEVITEYLAKTLGFPEENIITLLNDRATKSDFEKYFEKWLGNNVEKNSTIFVYYSGHGAPNPKTGDAYLVPYDGDPVFIDETGYSLRRLLKALSKLEVKKIIVALDSCFSGAGGKSVMAKGARPLVLKLDQAFVPPDNMIVMSASSGSQISSTYEEKGHGLFTYFLLRGIKNEKVVRSDGTISVSDLFGYVQPQVERIARKQYNNEQTPQLTEQKKN
jgi:C-terminal peptidase prc